jgi:hypothetical protein
MAALSMEMSRYAQVPTKLAEEIIARHHAKQTAKK